MSDKQGNRDPGETPVELNETFERLEARDAQPEAEVDNDTVTEREAPGTAPPETSAQPPRRGGATGVLATLPGLDRDRHRLLAAYTLWQMRQAERGGDVASELDARVDALERRVESPDDRDPDVGAALERLTALEREVDEKLAAVDDLNARLDEVTARLATRDVVSPAEFEALRGRIAETVVCPAQRDGHLAPGLVAGRGGIPCPTRRSTRRDAAGRAGCARHVPGRRRHTGLVRRHYRVRTARSAGQRHCRATGSRHHRHRRHLRPIGCPEGLVDELRQSTPAFTPEPAKLESAPADAGLGHQVMTVVDNVGRRLASLVDYRRDEQSIKPVLPPKQEYYLRQNLLFKLQLAQIALLRENQAIYDNSLSEAQEWIDRHFDPEHQITRTTKATLEELEGLDITREMPDVSESLRAVRETLKRFHRGKPTQPGAVTMNLLSCQTADRPRYRRHCRHVDRARPGLCHGLL
ncbi:MAG: uroporphyrinogen-III C-methyltransferase [Gammaproteobacteria bacterium]|nr:uroporphyrinogen-III C-methyltransferase [Gammaproteobacteria bacterium]